jgi:hypothetical protein
LAPAAFAVVSTHCNPKEAVGQAAGRKKKLPNLYHMMKNVLYPPMKVNDNPRRTQKYNILFLALGNPLRTGDSVQRAEQTAAIEGAAVAAVREAAGAGAGRRARGRLHGGVAHRAGTG